MRRPAPTRVAGPAFALFAPGSESTLTVGGSADVVVVAAEGRGIAAGAGGGGAARPKDGSLGFAVAALAVLSALFDFQPRPTPMIKATTPSATAANTSHVLFFGFGAETVTDAYDVFGVCHDGPVGPDAG
jgi:hypothetical protein